MSTPSIKLWHFQGYFLSRSSNLLEVRSCNIYIYLPRPYCLMVLRFYFAGDPFQNGFQYLSRNS